ncbi:hypothetical protein HPS57_12100 [Prevotella sp. PINT]|jgi:hypothetical protein|uniref:hypothetical protein n=1 Tax=Palleniella intestinalis TaxID=2736291 RepID=UPI0015541693|nr:hypothetical protein [Palleniella intestinalis]NPD82708.1 hypothetical protein [Palleniella intestinalis]
MKLFDLLKSNYAKDAKVDDMIPQNISTENLNIEEPTKAQEEKPDGDKIVTITYGTGMPIDVIFNFIRKDYETEGYNDALVSTDPTYKATKEGMIRSDLKTLFTQVALKYQNDIRMLDVEIANYKQACLFISVSAMESRRATFEEHLSKIIEMESQLDNNDPRMMIMIESYRRGFLKGMAAKAGSFMDA